MYIYIYMYIHDTFCLHLIVKRRYRSTETPLERQDYKHSGESKRPTLWGKLKNYKNTNAQLYTQHDWVVATHTFLICSSLFWGCMIQFEKPNFSDSGWLIQRPNHGRHHPRLKVPKWGGNPSFWRVKKFRWRWSHFSFLMEIFWKTYNPPEV